MGFGEIIKQFANIRILKIEILKKKFKDLI